MSKFHVFIQEVHTTMVEVEAKDKDAAREVANKMLDDGSNIPPVEYAHTVAMEDWPVLDKP